MALRERNAVPDELLAAIGHFYAGDRPAADAAVEWLRTIALDAESARTWLLVGSGRVIAYCALASGSVPLSRRQRAAVGSAYRTTPATIMAWAAKTMDAEVDGRGIVEHAVSMAIRVRRFQGNCVLGLDAFDEDVAVIWKERYGFWNAAPPLEPGAEPTRRLWISLDAFSR
ncbi:MAG: hypothetical protein ACRDK0_14180 [Solirubrobacteraceae bacterium]